MFGTQRDPFASTGRTEVFEMIKAWLAISVAFTILQAKGESPSVILRTAIIVALTAGVGFVLHELGHRVVARHFGAEAHFQANDTMLVIGILSAFAGFLFAAPGAVWYRAVLTKRQGGLIAATGPVVNMVLAVLFAVGYIVATRADASELLQDGLRFGFYINGWLGFFNMLPLGPIDGAKILNWSAPVFGVLIAIGGALAFYERIPVLARFFGSLGL